MANLPLALTCADYAHVTPLALGEVRPDGIDLTLVHGSLGSWPTRAEMLRRAIHDPAVHGGEGSVAGHVRRIDQGDRSMVGLPIFVLRNFTARDLYVRKGGPIKQAADLKGKRIGMYNWVASGSVWYRHFLNHIGVPIDSLQWWIGDIDTPTAYTHAAPLPKGINAPDKGRFLSEMLIAGELDAIYSPPRPRRYHPTEGPIIRLFPDCRTVERDYFRTTRCFPPQHLMIVKRDAWVTNPWIARSLTDAFVRCQDRFVATQRNFPYVSPWLDMEMEETAAVFGADFHPHGLEKARHEMDAFCEQAYRAGLTSRRVSVDECFQEYLQS
ncbi:MAG: hypothetical protein FJX35_01640 [Alphaproteobacteria bacterium]|nr:hypothetical protein [Alphaproteobacteria bacterium]